MVSLTVVNIAGSVICKFDEDRGSPVRDVKEKIRKCGGACCFQLLATGERVLDDVNRVEELGDGEIVLTLVCRTLPTDLGAAQLKAELFCAGCLRHEGFCVRELRHAGYNNQQLQAGGFDVREIFSIEELLEAGYDVHQLKAVGFDAEEIGGAGFSAELLLEAGFGLADVKEGVVDIGFRHKLRRSSFPPLDRRFMDDNKSNLEQTGRRLKTLGFTAKEVRGVGLSGQDLRRAGFAARDVRDAGAHGCKQVAHNLFRSTPKIRASTAPALESRLANVLFAYVSDVLKGSLSEDSISSRRRPEAFAAWSDAKPSFPAACDALATAIEAYAVSGQRVAALQIRANRLILHGVLDSSRLTALMEVDVKERREQIRALHKYVSGVLNKAPGFKVEAVDDERVSQAMAAFSDAEASFALACDVLVAAIDASLVPEQGLKVLRDVAGRPVDGVPDPARLAVLQAARAAGDESR